MPSDSELQGGERAPEQPQLSDVTIVEEHSVPANTNDDDASTQSSQPIQNNNDPQPQESTPTRQPKPQYHDFAQDAAAVPQLPDFSVAVTEPDKQGEGMNAFITYKVVTTKLSDQSTHTVERRFSDFAWLFEQFSKSTTGLLIPPCPEKAVIGRFNTSFVNTRRRALERYINRCVAHRHLKQREELAAFLNSDTVEFQLLRQQKSNDKPAGRRGFSSWMRESVTLATNVMGKSTYKNTQEDNECEAIFAYGQTLQKAFGDAARNVQEQVNKTKALSKAHFDVSLGVSILGQFETEQNETELGQLLKRLGQTADAQSVCTLQLAEDTNLRLVEPLQDYAFLSGAILAMMKTRAAALLTYQTALSALQGKQQQLAKLQGQNKADRVTKIEEEIKECQNTVDESSGALEACTKRVAHEMALHKQQKQRDIRKAAIDFVQLQIVHAKQTQAAWEELLASTEQEDGDQ